MTDITIKRKNNSIVEVTASGHTGYGESGEDIVCAGVSTLIQSALLGLLQVAQINVKYTVDEEKGSLRFTLPQQLTATERHDADVILNTMLCGLQDFYSYSCLPTKKEWVAPKTDVTAKANASAQSVPTENLPSQETFLCANAERTFTPATTWVSARTTPCLRLSTAW